MLVGNRSKAHTYPYIETKNQSACLEHEASTSKISEEELFYLNARGIDEEQNIFDNCPSLKHN